MRLEVPDVALATSRSRRSGWEALLFHPKTVHIPIALSLLMPAISGGLLLVA